MKADVDIVISLFISALGGGNELHVVIIVFLGLGLSPERVVWIVRDGSCVVAVVGWTRRCMRRAHLGFCARAKSSWRARAVQRRHQMERGSLIALSIGYSVRSGDAVYLRHYLMPASSCLCSVESGQTFRLYTIEQQDKVLKCRSPRQKSIETAAQPILELPSSMQFTRSRRAPRAHMLLPTRVTCPPRVLLTCFWGYVGKQDIHNQLLSSQGQDPFVLKRSSSLRWQHVDTRTSSVLATCAPASLVGKRLLKPTQNQCAYLCRLTHHNISTKLLSPAHARRSV